jgi:UDP-GlcNAc:undecaprenyl-phosphate GlcNAc-1-phosphate transferase
MNGRTTPLEWWGLHLLAFGLGFALCRLLLPGIIHTATARGWLDHPGDRRAHRVPVPRLGGVGIMAATALALGGSLALAWWLERGDVVASPLGALLPSVLVGCGLVFLIGVKDDLSGVSPRVKLLVQTLAALVVMGSGFLPHTIAMSPGSSPLELGPVAGGALTLLWLVGVTNAFNLIDGIDGLAGTMALVALGTVVLADLIVTPGGSNMMLSLAMAGALLAFLRLNWAPARIFLGDSGSMTLGFFLAVRTVVASTDARGVTYPVVPLVALAYPLLDTFTAMARRWVRGHPLSRADGRHIHHQLRALGFPVPRAVQLLALLFAGVSCTGMAIVFAPARLAAALALAAALGLFALAVYGVRWLGYVEFAEVGASIASVVRNARAVVNDKIKAGEVAERIRGAETLDEVRALLARLVEETRVLDVELVPLDEEARRYGPPSQQISPLDALPLRLDYPLAAARAEGGLLLRVWAARAGRSVHPAAERVANRIGPVLDEWLRERGIPSPGLLQEVQPSRTSERVSIRSNEKDRHS